MQRQAAQLGADLSTTALSLGVRSSDGAEDFASVKIRGGTRWLAEPAFHLELLPDLFVEALEQLQAEGWDFTSPGSISFSVRQHDMVLLSEFGDLLMPALSWQCNAAQREVDELSQFDSSDDVGVIQERFILPKLMWVLNQRPALRQQLRHVATTGDYLVWRLTGQLRLSTSDALSNALLDQNHKTLAANLMRKAGVAPEWFPKPIASGQPVGIVSPHAVDSWTPVRQKLPLWQVCAGLGDNHAGAVGCGLTPGSIVISAGSSGTVVRVCPQGVQSRGKTVSFEYYDDRLLLLMLADCAVWYDRFHQQFAEGIDYKTLNQSAAEAEPPSLIRIKQEQQGVEVYPQPWDAPLGVKAGSVQLSIAVELLNRARVMAAELPEKVGRFVLTGGLSQSPFFQAVLRAGLEHIQPGAQVRVSNRSGPLAFQAASFGALINAKIAGDYHALPATIEELCQLKKCESLPPEKQVKLKTKLAEIIDAESS